MYLNSQDIVQYILDADDKEIELIEGCLKLRYKVRSEARELANAHDLYVGDQVRILTNIKPKYLHLQVGRIISIEKDFFKVELDYTPRGGSNRRYNVPFSCVEKW